MEGGLVRDVVGLQSGGGREVLAGVDQAERGLGEVGAQREERAQRRDCSTLRDGDGEGCARVLVTTALCEVEMRGKTHHRL